MTLLSFTTFLLLIFLSSFASVAAIPEDQVINICAEDAGWIPYSRPVKLKAGGGYEFTGYNRDVAEAVFTKHNIKFKFEIRPWQRCLKEAIDGNIHIVLDAAANDERRRDYLLTNSVYKMTPAYFYHSDNDKSFKMKSADFILNNTPICGQSGYTYKNFGIPNEEVKKLSKALRRIIDLVRAKRCRIGLTRLEVLQRELPEAKGAEDISYSMIKDAKKEEFFWLINKKFNFSDDLKRIINNELRVLEQSGKLKEISNKYKI